MVNEKPQKTQLFWFSEALRDVYVHLNGYRMLAEGIVKGCF
jgi:hypothetical protein